MIISTFEHSLEVEQALAVLEQMGVSRSSIMTVMMENGGERTDKTAAFYPNKTTLAFEAGMGSATACSVVGISAGFVLDWGPLIWGMLTALFGFAAGFGTTRLLQAKYFRRALRIRERLPELAVIVECQEHRVHEVQRVLWEYRALSVGRIEA
ncbi:hypothetical protein I8J29_03870 [Paenibacillus sp. MWE-103]|uniref:Uncharacterized protein n=1 Tax=Paenibacillus artemisiicola TaxID=1172618 RepID=A0ABS3W4T1_9BACL|nr:hypothetical protein [Paenibacillus artemisiicola]MBO7743317.1 hypothetical protein [Paenibacillus artemisiicola]